MGITQRTERTAVALHDPMATPLGQMIEPYKAQLAPFLRDGVTLERVAAELALMARRTPTLTECPAVALVDAVSRGLELGAMFGRDAFIVPFKDGKSGRYEPTLMTHYKFEAELVVHAGGARSFYAEAVYDDELATFAVRGGTNPGIEHNPAIVPKQGRKLVGAYAVANIGFNHTPVYKWMPLAKIEARRAKSKEWNPQKVAQCPEWYACKTAVREVIKLLPKNAKLRSILANAEREEAAEFGDDDPITAHMERPDHVTEDGVDLEYIEDMETKPDMLSWAMDYKLPGKDGSWGGKAGQPLGLLKPTMLQKVATWALRQTEDPNGFAGAAELERAATLVLEAKGAGVDESTETFGGGHLGPNLPGEVEADRAADGQLPLGDKAKRPKSAQSEGH